MDRQSATSQDGRQWSWHVFQRWQQYDAEIRVNLLRILAIGIFYSIHLINQYLPLSAPLLQATLQIETNARLDNTRHLAVTALAFGWMMGALMIHSLLRSQTFPRWLPATSIALDGILLTTMLLLSSGAASPLVSGYFLILLMAGLRYDLRLIRAAAVCAMSGYLFVLGATRWPFGLLKQYPLPAVPRYHQLMVLIALALAAIILGQMIRQLRGWFLDRSQVLPGSDAR